MARIKHHAAVPVEAAPSAFALLWRKRREGIGYAALVTLMLTGLRSGEVRRLQWPDISVSTNRYAGPVIALPAERMKSRRDHVLPVSWPLAPFGAAAVGRLGLGASRKWEPQRL